MNTIAGILIVAALLFHTYRLVSLLFRKERLKRPTPLKNAELVNVLLNLEEKQLDDLFRLYQEHFGQSAARYARRTYRKWKAGEVRPNRQTFNRLLVHLPQVMSFDLKCEILRKFREAYCAKDNYQLTVYTDDWKESLTPLIESIRRKALTAELPKPIEEKLRWLSEGEMHVARAILAESQARESSDTVALFQQEITGIERLLADAQGAGKVTHKLKLPYGTIVLRIKRRR